MVIANLYNGYQLPPLPDYDKTVYPYAAIVGGDSFGYLNAHLVLSTAPLNYVNNNLMYWNLFYGAGTAGAVMVYEWTAQSADGFVHNETLDNSFGATGGAVQQFTDDELIWANYDVYEHPEGTTLVISASDPVPVTVLTARDLYRKINGQLVKLTLYKKLGGKLIPLDEHTKEVKT